MVQRGALWGAYMGESVDYFKWPAELVTKYPSLQRWNDGDRSEWRGGREHALLGHVKNRPDFAEIMGNPIKLLAVIDDFAINQQFLINIGCHKADILRNVLGKQKPKVIVELGGYIGYSAIFFAEQMRRQTAERVQVWSLEFDEDFAAVERELIDIAGLSEIATVVVGPAAESLRNLCKDGKIDQIDLLFLDHVESLYESDLKVAEELGLLKTGACIVADNVLQPGAPKYRQYVRGHPGLESRGVRGLIIPGELEDELEISRVL